MSRALVSTIAISATLSFAGLDAYGQRGSPHFGAPGKVFAKAITSMQVGVNWVPVNGADGYYVYRSADGITYDPVATVVGELNAYCVDAGLSASSTFYYRISAFRGSEESDLSTATVYSQCTTLAPSSPRGLSVVRGDGEVTLTWAENPEPNIAGYNVYRSDESGGTSVKLNSSPVTGPAPSFVDTACANYYDYYYTVSAIDSEGLEGQRSPETWARPLPDPAQFEEFNPHHLGSDCMQCHVSHTSGMGMFPLPYTEPPQEVCFACHDGTRSQYIIHQEFSGFYPSRHPLESDSMPGDMICMDCHLIHPPGNDFEGNPKLLHSYGNQSCWDCHGVGSELVGGDHETDYLTSAHNIYLPEPESGTGIVCNNCHKWHASPNASLTVYKEEASCFPCHISDASNALSPPDIFDRINANPDSDTHHDVLDADQALHGTKIECANCHNPHSGNAGIKMVDPHDPSPSSAWTGTMDEFCLSCHDGNLPTEGETLPFAPGVVGHAAMTDIATAYQTDVHGYGVTDSMLVMDPAMGYASGDVVACNECHEPHGTINNYNLRTSVTSKDGTTTKEGLMVYKIADGEYDLRYFCNACHGRNQMGNNMPFPRNCTARGCHTHGDSSF